LVRGIAVLRYAIVPLAALLVAATPPPPSPEEKAQLTAGYKQIVQAQVQASQCRRDTNGMLLPLSAALWQLEDVVKVRYGEASAKALPAMPKPAALPCGGAEDARQRLAADQTAFEYLTRLATVMQASGTPGWALNIVDVPALPPQLEGFRVQLGNILVQNYGEQQVRQMIQQIGSETASELAMACDGRKTARSATPRACPAIPAEFVAVQPIGAARIANLELMAQRFVQFGDNPFGPAYRQATVLGSLDELKACDGSTTVVYPKDPAAVISGRKVTLPLRNLGSSSASQTVTINLPATDSEAVLKAADDPDAVIEQEYHLCY
jgi:hypothetical protein